ncbi:hypothetical protein Ssi03_41090 [Sphaerisporangium siamense]|uniref:ChrR-like cupin domain-containing protein n=1 Tax=Sphaerisporangium siamense TaxID=795645 RepID=A0A7W7DCY9_9ACTN|nr:hypothetical protein [Sphaerisporangium siamense]MBB4704507.1 hypothetical protein [Sphaerisporangium siamense]GII86119.1 hypothetical protein Ssi03_41090 [Sphaerisporangium siamense]
MTLSGPAAGDGVDLRGADLPWSDVSMPGGSGPVRLARLHADPRTRASVSLVHFPPGWTRPGTGHYTCAEEFYVLHGAITVSGARAEAGTYAYMPPRATRTAGAAADDGCLAVAWFSGPPLWQDGPASEPPGHDPVHAAVQGDLGSPRAPRPEVPGGSALLSSVADLPGARTEGVDLLFVDAWRWAYVAPGEPAPASPGRVLVRSWPSGDA